MPSTSTKQHGFMAAIANNPSFAKKVGVPQSVGKDFNEADKGRKFGNGGTTQQRINKQDTKHGKLDMPFHSLNKRAGMATGGTIMKYAKGGDMPMKDGKPAFMKKGDATEMMSRRPRMGAGMPPSAPPVMPPQPPMGMNKGGMPMKDGKPAFMQKKMMSGGMAHGGMHMMPDGKMMKNSAMKKMNMGGMAKYAKGGGIESRGKTQGTIIKMAAGGSVSSRADGIAQRGKTKGKVI